MKLPILLILLLSGCTTFKKQPDSNTDNRNHTGINPYTVNEYPIAQQSQVKCFQGRIDEIISGNEATTIWYKLDTVAGLTTVRLPHTFPIKIKIVEKGFCYGYFDVTFKIGQ